MYGKFINLRQPQPMIPKIAVLIPDRWDRPALLKNCIRMMMAQTLAPAKILVVDHKPTSDAIDITQRYRIGYNKLSGQGFDCILFIENDDYYHPEYIKMMYSVWNQLDKPELLGTSYTYYYHIYLRKYVKMLHRSRASAMNTLIVPDLNLKWCADSEPFTDMWLWMRDDVNVLRREIFTPDKIYSLGMKHGTGKCGGFNHTTRLHRFTHDDADGSFLKSVVDTDSFEFYQSYRNDLRSEKFIA